MAGTKITVDITEVEDQRYGYNGITLDDYTDGAEPVISNFIEIAGSLYSFSGEDIDIAAAWGGIAADTIVYAYINPDTIVPYLSTTAPAWDLNKNGYYLAASPTHRCYMQLYKDNAGNYDQKTLIHDINMRIGKVTTDDLVSYSSRDGASDIQIATYTGAASGSDFIIKKPISCLVVSTVVSTDFGRLELKYNTSYGRVISSNTVSTNVGMVNPGTYRITNDSVGTTTIYAVGVYGSTSVTASEIVV